jgi:hypothetical protein
MSDPHPIMEDHRAKHDDLPPAPGPGYWYLAGPYSDDPETRYFQHMEATASLISSGLTVFSTIIHCHPMAHKYTMPTDADFWKAYNFTMIENSNGIIVYQLPTWKASKGVREEILFCQMRALPVWSLQPINAQKTLEWARIH